ncbi:MAG: transposase [Gemmataceae bacterium]|nr:transposase [Gemmataceae bacterium]
METIRTIVCKLDPTAKQVAEIEATLQAFAHACNHIVEVSHREQTTNKVILQHACYREVRATFGLSANLTVRAIGRVCAARKAQDKKHSTFAPTSIDYDQRIFSFRESDWTFSLTLLHARQRLAARLGERQRQALKGQCPTSATLVKRRDGRYFLHVQVSEEAPETVPASAFLGIDLGIVQIATDSDGNAYSGQPVEKIRRKHNRQRQRLQRKNSKGARKKLKRLAGKEARFRRHENHVISRRIVETAKRTGRGIALEDLKGIRERIRARGGEARNRLSGWAFHQLRGFIDYKALAAGIPVRTVNPRNTSRTCAECGHCERANRRSQESFVCQHCGYSTNADGNAARNIAFLAQADGNAALELAGLVPSRKAAGPRPQRIVTGIAPRPAPGSS